MNNFLGVDYSHWDGEVDWAQARRAGIAYAFCKASEGTTFVDSQFARNRSEAARVSIPMGAYHYYHPSIDPIAQAIHLCSVAPACCGLPHVIDLERTWGIPARFADKVLAFLLEVQKQTGAQPIIYTSYSYWTSYLGDLDWAGGYRLWIANYTNRSGPLVPKPWHPLQWSFWQWTDRGRAARYGSRKAAVDLNLSAGPISELTAW